MSVTTMGNNLGKHLYFAVGNFMFPKSRNSVGMQVLARMAKTAKNGWFLDKESLCHVSEYQGSILATPITYLIDKNVDALKLAMKNRHMGVGDVTVLTYSTQLNFGKMQYAQTGPINGNPVLTAIGELLQSEDFARLTIGISQPPEYSYNADVLLSHDLDEASFKKFFLLTKFTEKEQFALDNVLLPAAEKLLQTKVHDASHDYTFPEIMRLADLILAGNAKKEQFDELKFAQAAELRALLAQNSNPSPFVDRM